MVPPLKEVSEVKRFFALIASTVAFLAVAIPVANAAPAAPANACSGGGYALVSLNTGYSYNPTSSPHTLQFHTSGSETYYCRPGSSGSYQFEQNGTSRCLYLTTSSRTITEGDCSSTNAHWNLIRDGTLLGAPIYEIQTDNANRACIYFTGEGRNATYNPCSASNNNDRFVI